MIVPLPWPNAFAVGELVREEKERPARKRTDRTTKGGVPMRRGSMVMLLTLIMLLALAATALADGRPYVPPYDQPMRIEVSV